jgi:SAM-dependent methyltransferase
MTFCPVCQQSPGKPIYVSAQSLSITSLCNTLPANTTVFFCQNCGHLLTEPLPNLADYYDQTYKILIDSEEEDQLYEIAGNRKIFRTEHQVKTLLQLAPLPERAKVLDYGCAKSSTLKQLFDRRPDIIPHAFDVSSMYVPFWEKFIAQGNWAIYEPKPEWSNSFDLVTSFFALEHVLNPREILQQITKLLKPGGTFYCIVPNVYSNIADFVVADHVNHFSLESLHYLLAATGFSDVCINDSAHASAFVILAKKKQVAQPFRPPAGHPERLADLTVRVHQMADYWGNFGKRVRSFEQLHANYLTAAIYGSGFYGTFIAACLDNPIKVSCFLDQNPHRQKQRQLGKLILAPELLPENVKLVYVGLNPLLARVGIQNVAAWQTRWHEYFYP